MRLLGVIIDIGLITSTILSILHVINALSFNLQLWDVHSQLRVVGLLIVGIHFQLAIDRLVPIDTEGFWDKKSCLVPVSGWVFGSGV